MAKLVYILVFTVLLAPVFVLAQLSSGSISPGSLIILRNGEDAVLTNNNYDFGIGTSTAYSPFTLWLGSNTSTPVFDIVSRASTSVFRITGSGGLQIYGLQNCNTIDTDAVGLLSCGTDETGGGAGGGFDFPLVRSYGNATTTQIVFDGGFTARASSTVSAFLTMGFGSSTSFSLSNLLNVNGVGTSTFAGSVTITGITRTNQIITDIGNLSHPSIVSPNDTDVGLYFPEDGGSVALVAGSSEILTVNSTGVGILDRNPGKSLDINGTFRVNGVADFGGGTINFGNGTATSTLTTPGSTLTIPIASTTSFSIADRLWVAGAGTSTIVGQLNAAGLRTTSGLQITGGGFHSSSALNISSVATSSLAGGLTIGTSGLTIENGLYVNAGAVRTPLLNCNTIDSDGNGQLSCGTDETGGGSGSGNLQADFPLVRSYGNATTTNIVFDAGFNSRASSTVSALLTMGFGSSTSLSLSNLLNVNGAGTSTVSGGWDVTGTTRVGNLEILGSCKGCPVGGGAGNPAGSQGQLQYNDASTFAGASNLNYISNGQFAVGTTSPFMSSSTPAVLTVEATSTNSVPLVLRGIPGQTADLFRVHRVVGGGGVTQATNTAFAINNRGDIGINAAPTTNTVLLIAYRDGDTNILRIGSGNPTTAAGYRLRFDQTYNLFLNDGTNDTWKADSSTGNMFALGTAGIGTDTPGAQLGVAGEGLFEGRVTGNFFQATSSIPNVFPFASTTSFSAANLVTVSGAGTSTVAGGWDVTGTTRVGNLEILGACKGCPVGGAGTPGGADTQLQYNDGGAFGGALRVTYDDALNFFGVGSTSPGVSLAVGGAVNADYFRATSTSASIFPNATTTNLSVANLLTVAGAGTSTFSGSTDIQDDAKILQLHVTGSAKFPAGAIDIGALSASAITFGNGTCTTGSGSVSLGGTGTVSVTSNCTDAATVDSIEGASLLRSDATDSYTSGTLTFSAGTDLIITDGFGFGTATPGATFTVDGSSLFSTSTHYGVVNRFYTATSSMAFYTGGGANPRLFIDASGNVGIATTSISNSAIFGVNGDVYIAGGLGIGMGTTTDNDLRVEGMAQVGPGDGSATSTIQVGDEAAADKGGSIRIRASDTDLWYSCYIKAGALTCEQL